MHIRYFFVILLTVFIFLNAAGQFIFTPKKPIETLNRSITDKYETIQLKDSIPFSAIHIIDCRYDTTNIGLYLDGYLVLKDSTQQVALQHIIDKYYHQLYTPGKDTLLIQLEKFSVEENIISHSNFVYAAGNVSCKEYYGGNNAYQYYRLVDTIIKETYSYETLRSHKNGKHSNNDFWDYYLLRLCDAMLTDSSAVTDSTAIEANKYFTATEIQQQGLQKRDKPILLADSLKPGFYRNFTEFVNNEPTFLYENNESLKNLLKVMHYRVDKDISNEAPDTSYWGYCDGRNMYVRYGYNFYQLERRDAAFYIAPTLDATRRNSNKAAWNLLIGLAELSTSIAAKDGLYFDGFSTIPIPEVPMIALSLEPGVNILGLRIDLDTGQITY
ncbi:hypothetical protein FRZ67_13390 [Panacibacter ginsenosidivorans]|uniref:Uncharacterized protein n=1 Tax=Panacibacter ginsenosidivorans TaxID=1813871 RepID=A0A5B8VA69_9BACT|nr:hypothetical protein [Panacibacter ginsenosidivorans]QEC68242.1 hypothetical protein FRZ67_13390 [Panacibacter ginsenosidivorans]